MVSLEDLQGVNDLVSDSDEVGWEWKGQGLFSSLLFFDSAEADLELKG